MGRPKKGPGNLTNSSREATSDDRHVNYVNPKASRRLSYTGRGNPKHVPTGIATTSGIDASENWSPPVSLGASSDLTTANSTVNEPINTLHTVVTEDSQTTEDLSNVSDFNSTRQGDEPTLPRNVCSGTKPAGVSSDTTMVDVSHSADSGPSLVDSLCNAALPSHSFTDHPPDNYLWSLNRPVDSSHGSPHTIRHPEGGQSPTTKPTSSQSGHGPTQFINLTHASGSDFGAPASCKGQCYTSIIQRLMQLEHSLADNASQFQLDFVMTAVQNANELKERLFDCHIRCGASGASAEASRSGEEGGSCLDSLRPSLLLLAVFIDRVLALLEGVFRLAASTAYELDRSLRTAWYMKPCPPSNTAPRYGQETSYQQTRAAKRFERSVRSTFDRNIKCPVPEAQCRLRIGNFELDDEAKARAMKQILRLRISALDRTIADVVTYLGNGSTKILTGRGSNHDSNMLHTSRDTTTQVATSVLVSDMRRRIDLLQGRLELAG
ncbi:hypothetical protein F4859DRAFT_500270 [Xylaria cf. heliscus]|nr:hypothetical protein F4859DRAFT_500270 [Xylaria cf. heliscus]